MMTKHESKLIEELVMVLIMDWTTSYGPLDGEFLETDFRMMLAGDLESLRVKSFPLPYSGVVDEGE